MSLLLSRKTVMVCQQCWKPLILAKKTGPPKPHPCIFCNQCLQKCQPKYNDHQNGSHSWMYDIGQPGKLTKQRKEILLNASLQGGWDRLDVDMEANAKVKPTSTEDIVRRTLRRFDKRSAQCGLCKPEARHQHLVAFCFHCRKYLCMECSKWHGKQRFYRHHATVDLTTRPNTALL